MSEKENTWAPISRNLLRYVAGYLLFKQVVPPEIAAMLADDPVLVTLVAGCLATLVEGVWLLARKFGWSR